MFFISMLNISQCSFNLQKPTAFQILKPNEILMQSNPSRAGAASLNDYKGDLGIIYLWLFDLHSDDLFSLANDLHQLITLLHQLGLVHGCVHLQGEADTRDNVNKKPPSQTWFSAFTHKCASFFILFFLVGGTKCSTSNRLNIAADSGLH